MQSFLLKNTYELCNYFSNFLIEEFCEEKKVVRRYCVVIRYNLGVERKGICRIVTELTRVLLQTSTYKY